MFRNIVRGAPAALALAAAVAASSASADSLIPAQEDWVSAKKTVVTPDGLSMSYVDMGRSAGEPILLLHGYTDNSRSWSLLAPHLGDRRLIAVDLRGHGDSDAPACCYGLDSLAHDIDGFMEAMNIERADVVGHSLGSMTGAALAAYYPDRVDELVLISTAADMPQASADWLWENVPGLARPIDPEGEFMKAWYWNPTPVDEDFLARERTESAAAPEQTWMGVLRALSTTDWAPIADRIEAPVLVMWGDQDSLFGAETQARIRELLPEARHETFDGLGHNLFWEKPDMAGEMIRGFLTP